MREPEQIRKPGPDPEKPRVEPVVIEVVVTPEEKEDKAQKPEES